ncbi:tetratricopeptide repeat protein [Oleiharenicola lentus]|jgi:tetratricopeptide (TPR) repeat protein|uniref:Tetratricopeptide repeat protein n=1 Tax=Oleiharenicola lentus TaxID=2508720 RepID=A0A4Q1CBJ0_9BACT|nr:tetratricopeptide repeat protein [Oleiharenicola lentus]RXK56378.1 tetratricopeptide repeat protein [Oleiharenicola lentus]
MRHLLQCFACLGILGSLCAGPLAQKAKPAVGTTVINSSYNLLRNREPEMTADEHALYTQVVQMIPLQPEFALQLLESLVADDKPESPAFEFVLGSLYLERQRYEDAAKRLRSATERFPEFVRAWLNLGILHYTRGHFREAEPCFARALALGDRAARTYGWLGYCLESTGRGRLAEAAYEQAYLLDRSNVDWAAGLMRVALEAGEWRKAELLLEEMIRLQPAVVQPWLLLASVQQHQGRAIEALATLETAARLEGAGGDVRLQLARAQAAAGLRSEALENYAELRRTHPALGAEHSLAFARSLVAAGRLDEAGGLLEELERNPGEGRADVVARVRAMWLEATGRRNEAVVAWDKLVQRHPLDGEALLQLGRLQRRAGRPGLAALALERAMRIETVQLEATIEQANLALDQHDFAACAGHLRAALALQPSPVLQAQLDRVTLLLESHENTASKH